MIAVAEKGTPAIGGTEMVCSWIVTGRYSGLASFVACWAGTIGAAQTEKTAKKRSMRFMGSLPIWATIIAHDEIELQ
jgi:hypothetical protein